MIIEPITALIFLPFAFAIGIWVAWNDMKFMKIPNKAVLALMVVFVVTGLFALPFVEYLWRYLHFVVVLVIGFVANMARLMGAGDAKFLAGMAPFFDRGDALSMMTIFAGVLLAAFATHRLFRAVPAMRRAFPDWQSWEHPKFPMGLALSGSLILYLVLGAFFGGQPPLV
jgi:prepilin peptidase CpaA